MYAGTTVEELAADRLWTSAAHPYTRALLSSRPSLDDADAELRAIAGRPLSGFEAPEGCAFSDRCPNVRDLCRSDRPRPVSAGGSTAACHFPHTHSPEEADSHA
ncbi:oligopeptide/dipeptide ABC transporter ATP-binding protein [Streptomyces sp. NPDC029674]|uniref:oligopeptide/dipeptide ABC transporter ATP-binding protein n=1 Tax=Streptomyces sp. NPDC029674 TaxID=3365297 RepID=UPI003850C8CE